MAHCKHYLVKGTLMSNLRLKLRLEILGSAEYGFLSHLCYLLSVQTQETFLTFLGFNFLNCKTDMLIIILLNSKRME